MFKGIEKKKFYSIERVWYDSKEPSTADVVRYLRIPTPLNGTFIHTVSAETVFSDLKKSEEEILSACTKTIKYEVNKCEKEDVDVKFYTSDELSKNPELLAEFENAYLDFAKDLGIKEVLDAYSRVKIDNFVNCSYAMLSKAHKEGIDVYHFYAFGGQEACLNYSVSNYRSDPALRNLAARMNKLLHIRDMRWLRERGVTLYDWGNINSSETPNGIAKFKISFGGEVVKVYNSFVGNSLIGKCLVLAYKVLGK